MVPAQHHPEDSLTSALYWSPEFTSSSLMLECLMLLDTFPSASQTKGEGVGGEFLRTGLEIPVFYWILSDGLAKCVYFRVKIISF